MRLSRSPLKPCLIMKLLSWNIRGLNSQNKHRLLRKKFTKEKLDIVFLQETKCTRQKLETIGRSMGKRMEYMEVEGNGLGGGLAIFWNPLSLNLHNAEVSRSFISLKMQILGENGTYLFTNVYSPQRMEDKLQFSNNIYSL